MAIFIKIINTYIFWLSSGTDGSLPNKYICRSIQDIYVKSVIVTKISKNIVIINIRLLLLKRKRCIEFRERVYLYIYVFRDRKIKKSLEVVKRDYLSFHTSLNYINISLYAHVIFNIFLENTLIVMILHL